MSGVVYFIWNDDGEERYAVVPRDEIRFVSVRRNTIVITLTTTHGHDMTIPFDGGDDVDDLLDQNEIIGWDSPDQQQHSLSGRYSGARPSSPARSFSHVECKDKMLEALMQSVDVDCTFRWNGTTWLYTESRPT